MADFSDAVFEKTVKGKKPTFPNEVANPSFYGYFDKTKGTGLIIKWEKRYIVVVKSVLFYFKSKPKSSSVPKGIVDLKGAKAFLYDSGKPGLTITSRRSWSNGKHRKGATYNFLGNSKSVLNDFMMYVSDGGCADVSDKYNDILYKRSVQKSDAKHDGRRNSVKTSSKEKEKSDKEKKKEQDNLKEEGKKILGEEPKSVWKAVVDKNTKRTYYYNSETKATQWDMPEELKGGSEVAKGWIQKTDPGSGKIYYFNQESGETTWKKPGDDSGKVDDKSNGSMGAATLGDMIPALPTAGGSESPKEKKKEKKELEAPPPIPDLDIGDIPQLPPDIGLPDAPGNLDIVAQFSEMLSDQTLLDLENDPLPSLPDELPPLDDDLPPLDDLLPPLDDADIPPLNDIDPKNAQIPEEVEEPPCHWRATADSSGKVYYYNKVTKETTWTMPEGFREVLDVKYVDIQFGQTLPNAQVLPNVFLAMARYISDMGLEKQQLFSLNSEHGEVAFLKSEMETKKYSAIREYEMGSVVRGLKDFIAEVPGGVIPKDAHGAILACHHLDIVKRAENTKEVVKTKIPPANLVLLDFTMWFLYYIASVFLAFRR